MFLLQAGHEFASSITGEASSGFLFLPWEIYRLAQKNDRKAYCSAAAKLGKITGTSMNVSQQHLLIMSFKFAGKQVFDNLLIQWEYIWVFRFLNLF